MASLEVAMFIKMKRRLAPPGETFTNRLHSSARTAEGVGDERQEGHGNSSPDRQVVSGAEGFVTHGNHLELDS